MGINSTKKKIKKITKKAKKITKKIKARKNL